MIKISLGSSSDYFPRKAKLANMVVGLSFSFPLPEILILVQLSFALAVVSILADLATDPKV